MYPQEIVFAISDAQKIVIDVENPFDLLPRYCHVTITLYDGDASTLLNNDDNLETALRSFTGSLGKALDNKLQLDSSITRDIGYLYNEYLKYTFNDDHDSSVQWTGMNYLVWTCGQSATWLYNDGDGVIILAITPRYTGFFIEEGELVAMPLYEEWLQSYRPLATYFISPEVAHQWLIQGHSKVKNIINEQI